MRFSFLLPLLLIVVLVAGCAPDGPGDVQIGFEECAHCRMTISEAPFAAQLRTQQGRTYAFDSIECLAEYIMENDAPRGLWLTDFTSPGSWVDAEEAVYLQSPNLRSPMGMNLSAYASAEDATTHQQQYDGDVLTWNEVLERVSERGGHGHAH